VDHVDEVVRLEVHRGVDVAAVALAGVDAELDAGVAGGPPERFVVGVARAARPDAVAGGHRLGAPARQHRRVQPRPGLVERAAEVPDAVDAALAEVDERARARRRHVPQGAGHPGDEGVLVGPPEESVFQPVRRRDEGVEVEALAGLLRQRVAEVGVGVDERREDDVRRVGRRGLDRRDPAVLDDDAALDRLERLASEDRPLQYPSVAHRFSRRGRPL